MKISEINRLLTLSFLLVLYGCDNSEPDAVKLDSSEGHLAEAVESSEPPADKVSADRPRWRDTQNGISMICPAPWVLMTPSEVRTKTAGAMHVSQNSLIFCLNSIDPDQNINIQYVGDFTQEAPNNRAAKKFFSSMENQLVRNLQGQLPSFKKISSRITELSGGVALEIIFTQLRGNLEMKQLQVMIVKNGKSFTITCTAQASLFDDVDKNVFRQVLSSIVIQ